MNWIERLSAAVDYAEEHLEATISPDEAGKAAGMSPFHFQRTFSVIAGVPFAEYVRRRRLTLAAGEICEGRTILETALMYGWESQAAFTRSFKAMHGITPGARREEGSVIKAYPPLSFRLSIQGVDSMDYEIRKVPGFSVTGMVRRFTSEGGANFREIPKFWEEVMGDGSFSRMMADSEPGGLTKGGCMGICFDDTGDWREFDYLIGMEAGAGTYSAGLSVRDIPELTWAIFRDDAPLPEGIQNLHHRIMAEWFPATEYEQVPGPEVEMYADPDRNGGKMVYEIWLPVKRG